MNDLKLTRYDGKAYVYANTQLKVTEGYLDVFL